MNITVEVSLYPLQAKYKKPIKTFIRNVSKYPKLTVKTTVMSTMISGEYSAVMDCLTVHLKKIYKQVPKSATVIKIIPIDLKPEQGFLSF